MDAVPPDSAAPLAVLVSGGADSAVLLGEAAGRHPAVFPLYVRCGLYWEPVELDHLRGFLAAIASPVLKPLALLDMPVADIYDAHWSLTGKGVPGSDTPDDAVFLPGRNVLLLSKALLWCHLRGVPALAMAQLEANPFPDATPEFFRDYQDVVNRAVGGSVRVVQPYRGLSKAEVLRRGQNLPLAWTFSCIWPAGGKHCGACNKCAERRHAFAAAGLPDPTPYSSGPYLSGAPCTA
jgi:7-cyano-7-deazaguanine synthase